MNEFQLYVNSIVQQLRISNREKTELASEFMDHLLLLKQEFIEQAYTEKEAIRMAIDAFGYSNDITSELQQSMNPFHKWIRPFFWFSFSTYLFWFAYHFGFVFLERNEIVYGHLFRDHFTFDITSSLYDLFILSPTGLTGLVVMLFYSIITYGPLGFLWSFLFQKSFPRNLLASLSVIQLFHLFTFSIKLNMFDTSRILLHLAGFTVGYLFLKLTRYVKNKWSTLTPSPIHEF
ncbi:permease prefix domain 1-containing protein [Shimazuella kribbensis]|uniref:permease prefix domain 1-containing protein n=1 Tax=Shimazuella kribbensis TaxID=139808 RepID=UPI00041646A7|nr:permease prefix domain 1-containing protein [Shimazuella kribbensis]